MEKKYYAIKLLPNRPDFAQTMTSEERIIMQQHVAYWKKHMEKGIMLIFGPVLDPKATYGFGVLVIDNEDQLKELLANDPAAKINVYEYYPMLAIVASNNTIN